MPIITGIDEVGYGPILGPLVITGCTFLVPKEVDIWSCLKESVGKQKRGLGNRLLVTDSKKAYSRSVGIKHLERTTLAFLDQIIERDDSSTSFYHLLGMVSLHANSQLQKYPWYMKTKEDLASNRDALATSKLSENMNKQMIELLDVNCCYIDVTEFNLWVRSTNNKADILLSSIIKLVQQTVALASFLNEKHVVVVSDKIGGRTYYNKVIESLSDFKVVSLSEDVRCSKYKLGSGRMTLDIRFETRADATCFPVALSSIIGKYIREKVLHYMNEYFIELQPRLKPTAGYYTDGLRFLRNLEDFRLLEKTGISKNEFVRIK